MLQIINNIRSKRATNPTQGDIQTLLKRLSVEVVAANYRYFLHEYLDFSELEDSPERECWPPLLANERQVSGIFAHALSSVCPVSRPEMAITRNQTKEKIDHESGAKDRNGRMDFYATYGRRSIALELKRVTTSSSADPKNWKVLRHLWGTVNTQAKEALSYMRQSPSEFPHPAAIGLLVVRVSRGVTPRQLNAELLSSEATRFTDLLDSFRKETHPDFLAAYRPPLEMQVSNGWGKSGERLKLFPGIIFSANVWVNKSPRSK